MEKIDEIIKQSLNEEEANFYNNLDEPSVFEKFNSLFKGKNRWLTYYLLFLNIIFTGLTIYAAIYFFNVETIPEMLKWGAGMFLGVIAICLIKVFYFLEMNKNIKLRDIKKLELQILQLAKKIDEQNQKENE